MPFVTEERWRTLQGGGEVTLVRAAWPEAAPQRRNPDAESRLTSLQDAVTALRRFRADHHLVPSKHIEVIAVVDPPQRALLDDGVQAISRLVGVADWSFADSPADIQAHPVGKVVMNGGELFVPLAGVIDLDEERARLQRELDKATAELERAERKLSNESFVAKAPDDVVAAERGKVEDWRVAISRLTAQLDELG
jgi:valyl-tRNA synthetase